MTQPHAKPFTAPKPNRPRFIGKMYPPCKTSWWLNIARQDWQATVNRDGPQARVQTSPKEKG